MERKRIEAIEREKNQYKELMTKLEARRLEAAAKPQKVVAAPAKKQKKVIKLDVRDFFTPAEEEEAQSEPDIDGEEVAVTEQEQNICEEDTAQTKPQNIEQHAADELRSSENGETSPAPPVPPDQATAQEQPQSKIQPAKAAKTVIESKRGHAPGPLGEVFLVDSDNVSPSLADAAAKAPAKKAPAPPAKKKEKKKFAKLDSTELGWQV